MKSLLHGCERLRKQGLHLVDVVAWRRK